MSTEAVNSMSTDLEDRLKQQFIIMADHARDQHVVKLQVTNLPAASVYVVKQEQVLQVLDVLQPQPYNVCAMRLVLSPRLYQSLKTLPILNIWYFWTFLVQKCQIQRSAEYWVTNTKQELCKDPTVTGTLQSPFPSDVSSSSSGSLQRQ